jgi:hypothetical protein
VLPRLTLKVPQKRTTKKLLSQLRSKVNEVDDNDDPGYDEFDFHVSRRRPEFIHVNCADNEPLSDHVKFRLWLARQLALAKYQQKWA